MSSSSTKYVFDWNELAFESKKPLKELNATFIAAPRHISPKRFTDLLKIYLKKGPVILGVAKEQYVQGFEGQPQFEMLTAQKVLPVVDVVDASNSPHKLYILQYFQRDLPHIIEKIPMRCCVLVNGSWKFSFHNGAAYSQLTKRGVPMEYVSPFVDEAEARKYGKAVSNKIGKKFSDNLELFPDLDDQDEHGLFVAWLAARLSFDYTYQTGAILVKKDKNGDLKYIAYGSNEVVPYETYALHHGSLREQHFSPTNDLNYYDTIHAEMQILVKVANERLSYANSTLYINLMPCPTCARVLAQTKIHEIVYMHDHSDGYAATLLEKAGKKVRRVHLSEEDMIDMERRIHERDEAPRISLP